MEILLAGTLDSVHKGTLTLYTTRKLIAFYGKFESQVINAKICLFLNPSDVILKNY